MARPREFDEDVVLDQVLSVFWEKGFNGTSIEDLVESTGLGRASLYGAFGDKKKLFERSLALYLQRAKCASFDFSGAGSALVAIEGFLRGWVRGTCPKKGPKGCFLLLSGTLGDSSLQAREILRRWLSQVERELAELIERGQAAGEIERERDATALARLLLVVAQGIASSARAGWGHDRLSSAVDELMALVIGDAG